MKRISCLLLFSLLLFAGCTPLAVEPEATPAVTPAPLPTPAPIPTPAPLAVLCVADCTEEEAAGFFSGAEQAAQAMGWQLTKAAAPEGFDSFLQHGGYDGILALCTRQSTSFDALREAMKTGACIAITDMLFRVPPAGAAYAWYEPGDAAALALETALAYPPHDTPVRLIALLEGKGSPADSVFQDGIAQGKILKKALHYETDSKQNPQDFFEDQLDRYVEGMVDAVFVENTALAKVALTALAARGRTDMEVFSVPGVLQEQIDLCEKWTFPVAMGADFEAEGNQAAQALGVLLAGGDPAYRAFTPVIRTFAEL